MESFMIIFTIAVLAICVFLGYRKGMLGVVFGLISWVLVLVLMYVGIPYIEKTMMDGPIYEKYHNPIYNHVKSKIVQNESDLETTDEILGLIQSYDVSDEDSIATLFKDIGIFLPTVMKQRIAASDEELNADDISIPDGDDEESIQARVDAVNEFNDRVAERIATPIAEMMVRGSAVLLVVILSLLITRILGLLVNAFNDLPLIGGSSRVLGAAWGLCSGLLIIWLIMDVISCFAMTIRGQEMMAVIENNVFLHSLYLMNPLSFVITL